MRPSQNHFTDINKNFADVFVENESYVDIFFDEKRNMNLKDSHEKESVGMISSTLYITLTHF